jgi:hypothetical protein
MGAHSTTIPMSNEVSFMACQQHNSKDCADPHLEGVDEQLLTGTPLAPGRKPSGLLLHTTGDASKATSPQSCMISATTAWATSRTEDRGDLMMEFTKAHTCI